MKYRIKNKEGFDNGVFGAECFLKHWPELLTEGVELRKIDEFYYIFKNDKRESLDGFFDECEMSYLEPINLFDEYKSTIDHFSILDIEATVTEALEI